MAILNLSINTNFCGTSIWLSALYFEAGEFPSGVFYDISGAFACVNHDELPSNRYSHGVRRMANDWVTAFLEGQK